MSICGTTALYGIIGNPLAHSLSPLFQNEFLRQANIDAAYVPFPVPDESRLPTALQGLHACGVAGFNVTVPYKEAVMELVSCDHDSATIGAVNTVRRTEQGWEATNTDTIGIAQVISALCDCPQKSNVLLFGAGGTARAVLHACAQLGVRHVWLCNRTRTRAEALCNIADQAGYQYDITPVSWEEDAVHQACRRAEVVINTTTIGLHDEEFPFALPSCDGAETGLAFDAVYHPSGSTPFLRATAPGSRYCTDGLPLLIAQGASSFYYWHNRSINRQRALDATCRKLHRETETMRGWDMES